jgi:hypothetical protein
MLAQVLVRIGPVLARQQRHRHIRERREHPRPWQVLHRHPRLTFVLSTIPRRFGATGNP